MLPTTIEVIRATLKSDPTITIHERANLLAGLRSKSKKPNEGSAAERVDRIIRRREAARRLGLSMRAVDRLSQQGALRKRVLPGRKRAAGFLESDVAALITGESETKASA